MKCISCEADIPPQWVAAIQANKCPGCGDEIMHSETKELLDELTAAMERMPNDPRGVAGWLLSNYEFRKIGDGQPIEKFHRKKDKQEVDESNLKIADNPVNNLLKRSNAYKGIEETRQKLGKDGRLKEYAKLIQEQEEKDPRYGMVEDEPDNTDEDEAPEDYSLPESISRGLANDSLVDPNVKPLDEKEIKAISALGDSQEDKNKMLLEEKKKRVKSQQNLMSGGGGFRRGE